MFCKTFTFFNLTLGRHKLTEHEGVRYGCDLCSAVFSASTNLKRHKLSKHEGVRKSQIISVLQQFCRRKNGNATSVLQRSQTKEICDDINLQSMKGPHTTATCVTGN